MNMLPDDISLMHLIAVVLLLFTWFAYPLIFKLIGYETINARLTLVRHQWIKEVSNRPGNPFDAIMVGHIIHSIAFFGSATLIVLAGLFSIVPSLEKIHRTFADLHLFEQVSLELFVLEYALLAMVITICFFSFTYALRKLVYAIALIGALPEKPDVVDNFDDLVDCTTVVLTEALKTFNFGIRGYYYAVAALFLFISPLGCILATLTATAVLIYRQIMTPTSRAISKFTQQTRTRNK